MNRLATESSPYLLSAAHQPVHWYPWSDEPFNVARREDKPILLDIGAVWCHWCHVMDRESYDDSMIAGIINDRFVAIKVDRDERPDVDVRYQRAVGALAGQGGWPLTAFLTPEGEVFFGGTYFPPVDRYGRSGFSTVLTVLADAYKNDHDKVIQSASKLRHAIAARPLSYGNSIALNQKIIDEVVASISGEFDSENGGFGSAPKFPHSSALELLLAVFDRTRDRKLLDIVSQTLRHMAHGGIYDQLGGGFHRYSTDAQWIIPHFEKMLCDNASLLTNYVHAYQASGDPLFKDIALDLLRFVKNTLTDHSTGCFYASQDADNSPDDDGSYFTWSPAELNSILTEDEAEIARILFGFSETDRMHTDPSRYVLRCSTIPAQAAEKLGRSPQEVAGLFDGIRAKMLAARDKRKLPFVDKSVYADLNGMMIAALFEAYKAFHDNLLLESGLRALNHIMSEHFTHDGVVTHRSGAKSAMGFLADQVQMGRAMFQAFEATGKHTYLHRASGLIDKTLGLFADREMCEFYDLPLNQRGAGLLSMPEKPFQDSPVESAPGVALSLLHDLWTVTGNSSYREFLERSLQSYSPSIAAHGIFASRLCLALEQFLVAPPHVAVLAHPEDIRGAVLWEAAVSVYRPGKTVVRYNPNDTSALPEVLRYANVTPPVAYVCSQMQCAPPAKDPDTLAALIVSFGRGSSNASRRD